MAEYFKDDEVCTHSWRKGGAQEWIELGAARGTVQQQGGWKSNATMDSIYLALTKRATMQKLTRLAKEAGAKKAKAKSRAK